MPHGILGTDRFFFDGPQHCLHTAVAISQLLGLNLTNYVVLQLNRAYREKLNQNDGAFWNIDRVEKIEYQFLR